MNLIGNDCKLIVRLFSFYFYWGDALGDGVFHSEIEMDCNGIVWEILGLWEGDRLLKRMPIMRVDEWEKAKILYLAGKGWKAIADQLGLRSTTLQTKASKEGVTRVKREVSQIVSQSNQSLESLSILVRNRLASDAVSTLERIDNYELDGIKDESTREQILGSLSKRSALVFGWSESGESPSVSINLLGSMPDKLFHVEQSRARED